MWQFMGYHGLSWDTSKKSKETKDFVRGLVRVAAYPTACVTLSTGWNSAE
jgi:hypothetical protein